MKKESKGWQLWQTWGMPKYVAAPMVNQSELSFRLLVRMYGVHVTYSPMVNAGMVVRGGKNYLDSVLTTDPIEDSPLVVQLAGSNLAEMGEAVRIVKSSGGVNAVDINFGCPQGIANSGRYGAYLLNQPALIESVTKAVVYAAEDTPVFVKLRKVGAGEAGANRTLELCRLCIKAGAVVICLHGRTKEEKGQHTSAADWDVIKQAVEMFPEVPIIANGGLASYNDAMRCLAYTGAAAVMSGEALLENFAFFGGPELKDIDVLVAEYLAIAVHRNESTKAVKAHLFHALYSGLLVHTDLRDQLGKSRTLVELCAVAQEMKRRRLGVAPQDKLGWYYRYRRVQLPSDSGRASHNGGSQRDSGAKRGALPTGGRCRVVESPHRCEESENQRPTKLAKCSTEST